VVYGDIDPCLVFIPREAADELAGLRRVLSEAATWGDFTSHVAQGRFEDVVSRIERRPADEEPFDADMIPGYADGDWPEWPAQQMLQWMPPEAWAYGSVEDSLK
jgi:hypothetical protein